MRGGEREERFYAKEILLHMQKFSQNVFIILNGYDAALTKLVSCTRPHSPQSIVCLTAHVYKVGY